MSKIVTYSNKPTGKYCQIKLDDGNRILISISKTGIKVYKLLFGFIPIRSIINLPISDFAPNSELEHEAALEKLVKKTSELNPLDCLKELLLPCKSIGEVEKTLIKTFGER